MTEVENKNKVPKSHWKKWSNSSKEVFNDVFAHMYHNQDLYTHPKTIEIPKEYWGTTAWNAAWIAADFLRFLEKRDGEEKDTL